MDNAVATIFVVADDVETCRALGRLLRSAGYRTRLFHSAREFLAGHDPQPPGCILLDVALRDLDGRAMQTLLESSASNRPIIFLTGNTTLALAVAAIRARAVNFLVKPVEERSLFEAVREALRIDSAERNAQRVRESIRARLRSLTPREQQVLEQVVRGRLNKQIAADLGTVEKTVKVHRARVMRKMGAHSVAELVQLASAAGIAPERWFAPTNLDLQ